MQTDKLSLVHKAAYDAAAPVRAAASNLEKEKQHIADQLAHLAVLADAKVAAVARAAHMQVQLFAH